MERQSTTRMSDQRQNGASTPASDAASASLTLETLGGAALLSTNAEGRRTAAFGPSKPLALIAYLASVPGNSATREFLIDLLWADLDPDAGRHAFRQTLWYIKQKTGLALIKASGDTVSLAEPICSDRADFLRAVEQRDFETAVSLYDGDFLPDFAAPGGLEFEHWADLERQRLRDTFARAAEHVIRLYLSVARHRDAVTLARRARDMDPLSEKAWRLLLESLVSANDSLGASLEADALQKMLTDEDREPEPATRAMLRTARQLTSEPLQGGASSSAIVAELVGREAEFATLLAAWDAAKSGTSRSVFIVGTAGIGKTRLIADVLARLRATRARVVSVRASPGERDIAYSLLGKLAGALATLPGAAAVSPASAAALVALNPTLSASFSAAPDRSTGPDALRRRTMAMHELLTAAADEAPVAVIVDDLHWADRESTRAFAGVVDLIEHERVLLIAAARPSHAGTTAGPRNATVLRLAPLSSADTGALLASIGAMPDSPIGARLPAMLRDASDGVPLLAVETLQFLLDRKLLALEADGWVIADEQGLVQALNAGGALRRRIESLGAMDRSVLNGLALAGVPVHAGFVGDVVQRPLPDAAALLHSLETSGMVNHVGDGWEPVHDQIGELALGGLDPEARRAADIAVGRAWVHAGPDDLALRRAGSHFLRAGDQTATAHAFALWVRHMRHLGDHRGANALAAEFMDSENETAVHELVRRLPVRLRLADSRWWVAAAVVVVAATSAAATWQLARQPARLPNEQFLGVNVDSNSDTTVYQVGIRRDRWTGGNLLIVPSQGRRTQHVLPATLTDYSVMPDGKAWISHATMPDSGGNDLVFENMTGRKQRLTWARGDDEYADVAPDGSQVVFATGRFDSLSHAQLAIMDLATHHVRRLTVSNGADGNPKWSPSGIFIAFTHSNFAISPDSLCTIHPDGSDRRCFDIGNEPLTAGWIDDNRLVARVQNDSLDDLDMVDPRDGSVRRIQRMAAADYELSPDGQWMYCQCREAGAPRSQPMLFPMDSPELARPVVMGTLDSRTVQLVWISPRPPGYVTALSTRLPPGGLTVGSAYPFTTLGVTADGHRTVLPPVSVRSLDPGVLQTGVGDQGIPVAPGTARVLVSAGGWRTDTITVPVVANRDSTVLHEDWLQSVEPDFVPFGDPMPVIVRDSSGRPAFWNHGDGDFSSGAYSRATFDASHGLGLETTLSMPISMTQWQEQEVSLRPLQDSAALARWDHRSGYPPWGYNSAQGSCSVTYPGREGARSIHTLSVSGLSVDPDTMFRPSLHDGHWFRLRLQLFPDGRCGVAINGRPIAIANTGALPATRYFVDLEGQSYHTRMLTGPVDVWTGIRPGVDWLGFDTTRARRY
jgi:DNA-binding SARP family transcriptional activator